MQVIPEELASAAEDVGNIGTRLEEANAVALSKDGNCCLAPISANWAMRSAISLRGNPSLCWIVLASNHGFEVGCASLMTFSAEQLA